MFHFRKVFYPLLSILILTLFFQCKNDDAPQVQEDDITSIRDDYFEDYESPIYKWGFIDKMGKTIVDATYDNVRSFSQGRAAINYKGQWGFIDTNGDEIIKPQYMKASSFSNGLANVRDFEGHIGYINLNGDQIIKHKYKTAGKFINGKTFFLESGEYGYIDNKGDEIIAPLFTQAWPFHTKNCARVKMRKHYVLIDASGEVISKKMDKIYPFSEGHYRYKLNGKYGLLDSLANIILPATNEFISTVKHGFIIVRNSDQWILKNVMTTVETNKFDTKVVIIGENQLRYENEGKMGMMDFDANILCSAQYDQINAYSEEQTIALQGERWFILNKKGQLMTDSSYTLLWDSQEGMTKVINQQGIGFLNQSLKISIPEIYLEAKAFSENRSAVKMINKK